MSENTPDIGLREAQGAVDRWIGTIGVRYFSPLTNMAVLTEEVGEVADELADVVWVVAAIANQTGVDLAEAFRVNLDKKTRRDATRHRDNPKLHNQ